MRQKRAKTYRKLMSLYSLSFGFRQPYQMLVDSEFCKDALSTNTDVAKQLASVLQGTVKPMITQCCIHELYLQGKTQQPAVDLAKTFERRKCNHREPIPGDECLTSVVGETNKHRYAIASQSQPLRFRLRAIPGVPIVHINRSVMILEPPSEATLKAKDSAEEQTLQPSAPELAKIKQVTTPGPSEPLHKKRKGPKGPNPLSVKKKTPKAPATGGPKPKPTNGSSDARAKGKGRATIEADTRSLADTVVRVGEKRGRGADEGDHELEGGKERGGELGGMDGDAEAKQGGHKRKRRRKLGAEADAPGVQAEDD